MQTFNSLQFPVYKTFWLYKKWIAALLVMFCTAEVNAQAVTIIGNSSNARDCYYAAAATAAKLNANNANLDACNRALETEVLTRGDKARTLINRGIVLSALEKYTESLADYNAASKLMPDMPEAFISRGNLWFLAEKYERAVSEYTQAMNKDFARMHIAYYNRGITNEQLGKHDAALADLQQALQLKPEFKQAKDRLEVLSRPKP